MDTTYLKLQRMGFIESELLQLKKENDTSYTAIFFLGKKYSKLKVFYSEEDFSKKELQRVASEITDLCLTKTDRTKKPKRKCFCAIKTFGV